MHTLFLHDLEVFVYEIHYSTQLAFVNFISTSHNRKYLFFTIRYQRATTKSPKKAR